MSEDIGRASEDMAREHAGTEFVVIQHVLGGGRGKSGRGCREGGGWVCNLVLTTSKGVTEGPLALPKAEQVIGLLVNAVIVDPVAAAMSFAWNGSMKPGPEEGERCLG
jgi:hypothetical protein